MGRRKGISPNAYKSRGGVMTLGVQQTLDQTMRDPGLLDNTNENMKPNSVAMDSAKELNSFNNNNDNRYLHKKFKKMATVLHSDNDLGKINHTENMKLSCSTIERSHNAKCNDVPTISPRDSEFHEHLSGGGGETTAANNKCTTVPSLVSLSNTSSNGVSVWGYACRREPNVQNSLKEDSHSSSCKDEKDEYSNHDSGMSASKTLGDFDMQMICENGKDLTNNTGNGKHICPYCKLSCAKPSVLQKHIRAHTNERPYPCVPCGFAFKTKSNLYKHCRSRSHALRLQGSEEAANVEDDCSLGSETDIPNGSSVKSDFTWNSDRLFTQSDYLENSTETESISSPSHNSNLDTKSKSIYKPKFHKASLYTEDEDSQRNSLSPSSEFFKLHISKIISDNEAIVDARESLLHRKYLKNSSNNKVSTEGGSSDSKSDLQPLNLTKNSDSNDANYRKRCYSESFVQPDSLVSKASLHPLNPEGSIIKDLLLKARAQARGLLPVTSETYDGSETLYTCTSCQIPFRSADNLEIHSLYYCKSNSAAVNAILSSSNAKELLRAGKSDLGFMRSNSVHVTLPETYNPNTLAKLASSTLKTPLRANKPENLTLHKTDSSEICAPLPSPGPLLGNTRLVDTHQNIDASKTSERTYSERKHSSPLKRKEECLANDLSRLPKINEENMTGAEICSPQSKLRNLETPTTLRSLEELCLSPLKQNSTSLQMFGGEVKILDNTGGTTTMRIEPLASQHSPTMISQSKASPKAQGPENIFVRSGLHSGGTIVHNPPTPKEPLPSPHPQTPRLVVSIAPNISTPNLTVSGIPAPNLTKFQFPPIGSITAYNPLTLPPLSSPPTPGGPTTILHGGKMIPYVPGMPGPNSLPSFLPVQSKLSFSFAKHDVISKNSSESKGDIFKSTELSTTPASVSVDSDHPSPSQMLKKFNTSVLEKKETQVKYLNLSKTSQINKLTIPTIKIISDLPSPVAAKVHKSESKTLLPQHKIDEILKRNSEILQRNDISREGKAGAVFNFKLHMNNKSADKIQENHSKDDSLQLIKHSIKSLCSNSESNEYNFENLISKSEILNKTTESNVSEATLNLSTFKGETSTKISERSETSYFKKTIDSNSNNTKSEIQKPKFLRPTSLPLKPGTFTPKRHHGITPNANTLPLISPETPRPAKAYGQLYLNGHAYTYLGLKCSTKVYYCTLNRPQPTYVPNQHSLSMYSNWQVCSEATPHPLGLTPGKAMVYYDSRHRPQNYSVATIKQDHLMTHSSQWSLIITKHQNSPGNSNGSVITEEMSVKPNSKIESYNSCKVSKNLSGGFESNEEYTYVRGRGRGRYVCSECGIRCKKPSMLKKHIRTHTDVRPFTCKHCAFSFKTKGNLTKHMKSKAHYKKCMELGISPMEEGDNGEGETTMSGATGDSEDDSDYEDDGETESSDTDSWKSRLEHEAAHCLLSLHVGQPAPGLLSSARPTTYPYTPNNPDNSGSSLTCDEMLSSENKSNNKKQMSKSDSPCSTSSLQSCYPMDLGKHVDRKREEQKSLQPTWIPNADDILTPVGEPDLLASLAQSTAKLPQRIKEWHDDEPMLQAYLTERALQDSKMKQSQYKNAQIRQMEYDSTRSDFPRNTDSKESSVISFVLSSKASLNNSKDNVVVSQSNVRDSYAMQGDCGSSDERSVSPNLEKCASNSNLENSTSTENAKFVASEYLKAVCGKTSEAISDVSTNRQEKSANETNANLEELSSSEKDVSVGVVRKVVVEAGGVGFKVTPSTEFCNINQFAKGPAEDGRSVCDVCNKTFSKHSQLRLHLNIHYMERPFRCSACAVSFRTRGHLQKHERSSSHHNKVSMTSTFGAATTTNPRPFKCSDCKIAFRIHGHLAKHLRSKMHVMRLECLGKLPFGTFAEIERAGISLTDIDTTDCDNSLASLQLLAQRLHEKDPSKLEKWDPTNMTPTLLQPGHEYSDDDEPSSPQSMEVVNECSATNNSLAMVADE